MSKHVSISPEEAADRVAIRELVEAYAHCADRRDAKGQMSLFTADTHFVVFMNAKDPAPSQELHSREELMSKHVDISPKEAADRLAIRELVEAYAHCADRRDAKGQMSLFTADTHFVVYLNAKDPKPSQELANRAPSPRGFLEDVPTTTCLE